MIIPRITSKLGFYVQMGFDRLRMFLQFWLTAAIDPVANLAELALVAATTLPSGTTKWVGTLRTNFVLDKTSILAPDAITVIAAIGGGNWIRVAPTEPDALWLARTTWYVNAVTGDDENSGSASGTALATYAEYIRRVGEQRTIDGITVDVTILSDLPSTDPIYGDVFVMQGGAFHINGWYSVPAVPYTVDVWTKNLTTNNPGTLTNNLWTAADEVGKMIRFTTGPSASKEAWVFKDGGAGVAVITGVIDAVFTPPTVPVVTNEFFVLEPVTVFFGTLRVQSDSLATTALRLRYLDGASVGSLLAVSVEGGGCSIESCSFAGAELRFSATTHLLNCMSIAPVKIYGGGCFACAVCGGLYFETVYVSTLGTTLGYGMVSEGALVNTIVANAPFQIGSEFGAYEQVGGINLADGAICTMLAGSTMHGKDNAGALFSLSAGTTFVQLGNVYATTAVDEIANVDGQVTAIELTQVPFTDAKINTSYLKPDATLAPAASAPSAPGPTVYNAGIKGVLAAAATNFALPDYTESASEVLPFIVQSNGTLRNLRVRLGTAVLGGADLIVTVFVDGVSSGLTVTVPALGVSGVDVTHFALVTTGQLITFESKTTGGAGAADLSISLECN